MVNRNATVLTVMNHLTFGTRSGIRRSTPGIEGEHAAVNDGTSARVDARKSRDALERTSTTHWTVSVIVSITACCIIIMYIS